MKYDSKVSTDPDDHEPPTDWCPTAEQVRLLERLPKSHREAACVVMSLLDDAADGERRALARLKTVAKRAQGWGQKTPAELRLQFLRSLEAAKPRTEAHRMAQVVAQRLTWREADPKLLTLDGGFVDRLLRERTSLAVKAAKLACKCGAFGQRDQASAIEFFKKAQREGSRAKARASRSKPR